MLFFFKFLPKFRQSLFFFLPFLAMTLPQLTKKIQFNSNFFSLPFSAMALPQLPFFFPISVMALPQLVFFFLGGTHTSSTGHTISFFFLGGTHTSSTGHIRAENLGRYFGNIVAEIQNFLSSTFSSFSLILLLNFGNGVVEIHSLSSFR